MARRRPGGDPQDERACRRRGEEERGEHEQPVSGPRSGRPTISAPTGSASRRVSCGTRRAARDGLGGPGGLGGAAFAAFDTVAFPDGRGGPRDGCSAPRGRRMGVLRGAVRTTVVRRRGLAAARAAATPLPSTARAPPSGGGVAATTGASGVGTGAAAGLVAGRPRRAGEPARLDEPGDASRPAGGSSGTGSGEPPAAPALTGDDERSQA